MEKSKKTTVGIKEIGADPSIAKYFGILNRTYLSFLTQKLKEFDLSYSESIFLVHIGKEPGITQEHISEDLAIDKAAIARSVKSMIEKDYIRYILGTRDKREKKLFVTEKGQQMNEKIHAMNMEWMDQVFRDLDPEKQLLLKNMMESISSRAKVMEKRYKRNNENG